MQFMCRSKIYVYVFLCFQDEIRYLKDNTEETEHNDIKIARVGYEDYKPDENKPKSKYGYISCGRSLLRCVWACYDTLERACRHEDCSAEFEEEMERMCKSACIRRFHY